VFDLIVFDMDGVLVDSEPIANRILHRYLAALGVPMTLEDVTRDTLGLSTASTRRLIQDRYGIVVPEETLAVQRAEVYAAYETELKPVPGIVEALESLPHPRCVASSSSPETIAVSLRLTGLDRHFGGKLFSAHMVERGKPHPDLFLHAARTMGHAPERTVVVEDSVPGVTAGVAAGMRVFAYAGADYADPDALAAAGGAVFTDMRELPKLLGAAT
jgi:HAD superfamily hydrolase (TIGR01509 family)